MPRAIPEIVVIGLVLALVIVIAAPSSILQALGDFLVVRDALLPSDAVIAISGDGIGERAAAAATLVREGYAPWLILSGSPGDTTAVMVNAALRVGVPRDRILVDDQSNSTLENARNTARLMQGRGLRRAIMVTSPYHTRRAAWVFRSEFLPRRMDVRVTAVENSYFDMHLWWTRHIERLFVIREYAKLAGYLFGLR